MVKIGLLIWGILTNFDLTTKRKKENNVFKTWFYRNIRPKEIELAGAIGNTVKLPEVFSLKIKKNNQ